MGKTEERGIRLHPVFTIYWNVMTWKSKVNKKSYQHMFISQAVLTGNDFVHGVGLQVVKGSFHDLFRGNSAQQLQVRVQVLIPQAE